MATATIKPKCGTTAQWLASGRILEFNEWGVEITKNGSYILRIGDGEHFFHDLKPVLDVDGFEVLVQQTQDRHDAVMAFSDSMVAAVNAANTAADNACTAADTAIASAEACKNIAAGINSMTDGATNVVYSLGVYSGSVYLEEV